MSESTPRAPAGLRAPGRRFWQAVNSEYDLGAHEIQLLEVACRVVDRLEQLHKQLASEPVVVLGPGLASKAHPLLNEYRQHALVLARLAGALRLPVDLDDDDGSPWARRRPRSSGGR